VLKATNIFKRYASSRGPLEVLAGVSLSLDRGDAASIMGPSGSGKSSLLYVLGALEPPSEGEVTLDGANPYTLGERELAAFRNRQVGFVFQDHFLLPQCTVLENVLAPTLVDAAGSDGAALARAKWLIGQVGLADRVDHRPAELSGGERQRTAIARALVRQPQLLLCDEPTGNLDRESGDAIAALLLDLHAREKTMLIVVTHNATLADRFPRRYTLVDRRLVPRP
jgi:lipoprotein-releasing system ATP-binding protein